MITLIQSIYEVIERCCSSEDERIIKEATRQETWKGREKDADVGDNVEEGRKKKRWMIRRTEGTKRTDDSSREKQLAHKHTSRTGATSDGWRKTSK